MTKQLTRSDTQTMLKSKGNIRLFTRSWSLMDFVHNLERVSNLNHALIIAQSQEARNNQVLARSWSTHGFCTWSGTNQQLRRCSRHCSIPGSTQQQTSCQKTQKGDGKRIEARKRAFLKIFRQKEKWKGKEGKQRRKNSNNGNKQQTLLPSRKKVLIGKNNSSDDELKRKLMED